MTFDQVKASEEMPSIGGSEESKYLEYETSLNGTKATVLYYFHNNALYSTLYLVYPNNNKYINEYTSLQKLLKEKYGKPSVDRKTFNSDLYKDDPSGWETAIAIGDLTYEASGKKGTLK
jgi:hypothetical protein